MTEIRLYTPELRSEWDSFIDKAKNATFLFKRGYMDYHSQRFADSSLLIYKGGKLKALLPANIDGNTLYSHQGLTYGGLVISEEIAATEVTEIFRDINLFLKDIGINRVIYKALPHIYSMVPSEEPLYALHNICGARIIERDISSAINLNEKPTWSRDRKYSAHRAFREGIVVERSDDTEAFWNVLETNLMDTYGVRPVHTLEEINLLRNRFPNNIILYTASHEGEVVAGTILYVCGRVIHAQYISANKEGKRLRAIDAIYSRILNEEKWNADYFDFGRSTEDFGRKINEGLIHQKEGFGGRGVCYDTYEWEII